MNTLAYRLMLLMVFTMPWENVMSVPGIGKVSRFVGLLVGLVWVISVVSSGRMREPRTPHVFAILFVLWNACTLMWTSNGAETQERVFTYVQLAVLVIIIWDTVGTPERVTQTLLTYLAGCYVTAVFLVVNVAQGGESEMYGRATLGAFHPNDVAQILALGLPIAGYVLMSPSSGRWRLVGLVAAATYIPLTGFAVLVTGSRAGLAALLPGIAYIVYRLARRRPGAAVASLGAVALLAVVAFPLAPPRVRLRLEGTASALEAGNLNSRETVWAEAIRLIQDHPLLGIGAGAFRDAAVGANKVGHNFILSLLAETGVVGFGFFMAMLVTALLSLRHVTPLLREMWIALFTAWTFGALLHNWEYRKQTWLFIGLVVVCGALAERRRAQPSYGPRIEPVR